MHYKIMPDPDDVEAFVLAQREPEIMIPVKGGGIKRQVQRASDGSWKLS